MKLDLIFGHKIILHFYTNEHQIKQMTNLEIQVAWWFNSICMHFSDFKKSGITSPWDNETFVGILLYSRENYIMSSWIVVCQNCQRNVLNDIIPECRPEESSICNLVVTRLSSFVTDSWSTWHGVGVTKAYLGTSRNGDCKWHQKYCQNTTKELRSTSCCTFNHLTTVSECHRMMEIW